MCCFPGAAQLDRMSPRVGVRSWLRFSTLFPLGLGKGKGHPYRGHRHLKSD